MADPTPREDTEPEGTVRAPDRPRRRARRLDNRTIGICVCIALLAALVAGLITSFVTGGSSAKPDSATLDSGPVGKLTKVDPNQPASVPSDPVPGLTGPSFKFSDFAGKPVVINFFSTSCGPCVKEMPGLEQLHQQLGDRVTFVGIDMQDTEADGKALVARTGVTYRTGYDPEANLIRDFNGQVLPTTVVIGPDGKVRDTLSGALKDGQLLQSLTDHQLLPAAPPP